MLPNPDTRPIVLDVIRLQQATRNYLSILSAVSANLGVLDDAAMPLRVQILYARIECGAVATLAAGLIGES
jgi:hypothetical protein